MNKARPLTLILILLIVSSLAFGSMAHPSKESFKGIEICVDGECYLYKGFIPEAPDERVREFNDAIARIQVALTLEEKGQIKTKVESLLLLAHIMVEIAEDKPSPLPVGNR